MSEQHPRDAGRVVIVGGGLAGYGAAEHLRQLGHTGTITIVDQESALYDRPPLSKELFADDFSVENLLFADREKLERLAVDVIYGDAAVALDAATALGAEAARVTLASGRQLPADTVLLATGGRARTLAAVSADDPAIIELRTIDDALRLRTSVAPGTRVVVVGAGLIGAEVSSALLAAGAAVDLISPIEVPLVPAVGERLAAYLHGMHETSGIRVHHASATAIVRDGDDVVVDLSTGERLAADVVVVGIGIEPNTALAETAGIDVDGGIIVDSSQKTSAPRVYAAGDCSRRRSAGGTLERRQEHWEGAQLSGRAAAEGMLGLEPTPIGAEWFWSDRHGVHLEAVGRLSGPGTTVRREGGAHPAVFLVDDGLLVGAATIDDSMTVRAARRIIDQGIPVSEAELADRSVALKSLLKAAKR